MDDVQTIARSQDPTPVSCCAPLASPALSDDQADATAAVFCALADPTRVRIVNLLATSGRPVCVCDLVPLLGLAQPTVSHHLKRLVTAGLLVRQQRGTWAHFTLDDAALDRVSALTRPGGET